MILLFARLTRLRIMEDQIKKRGIFYNDARYMLKMSDRIREDKRNDWNSSYTNSAFSEYLGGHIIASIGLNVQETLLGTMTLISSMGIPRIYPVVACKKFCTRWLFTC